MPDLRLPSLPGSFPTGGGPRYKLRDNEPYPPPPAWFVNSLGEWVVWYYLTEHRAQLGNGPNLRPVTETQPPVRGLTFFYQIKVEALGLFSLTPTTRIDFFLPGFGQAGYDALILDPYNEVVHGGFGAEFGAGYDLDIMKRQILAEQANAQLIWLHSSRLDAGDWDMIEAALRGEDQSPRALLGI